MQVNVYILCVPTQVYDPPDGIFLLLIRITFSPLGIVPNLVEIIERKNQQFTS